MIEFTVPVRVISEANCRDHWTKKRERRITQQTEVDYYWRQNVKGSVPLPVTVTLTRIGPKPLDDDNLANGFKAIRDHIARLLQVDDGSNAIKFRYQQEAIKKREYGIRVTVGLPACTKVVYLCGGINGLTDGEASDWREEAKRLLYCRTLDPMRRDYRGKEEESVEEIVQGDLADIYACTHLLVNAARPSWGTAMETWHAKQCGKIIVAIVPEGSVISPWLRYCANSIHPSLAAAVQAINEVAK